MCTIDEKRPPTTTTTTVMLGSYSCPCIGIASLAGTVDLTIDKYSVSYPVDLGSYCSAWDDGLFPNACKHADESPGMGKGWCAEKWCYVDPCNCDVNELPGRASYIHGAKYQGRDVFYSYETCGSWQYWSALQAKTQTSCKEQSPRHNP